MNSVTFAAVPNPGCPLVRIGGYSTGLPEIRVLIRRRLKLIARVLSLALLVGQFGAEAHAYSHLADDSKGPPGASQSCRACLSFAPVQAAVGGSPTVLVMAPCVAESFAPLDEILVPNSPSHRAFQSRAPPVLL